MKNTYKTIIVEPSEIVAEGVKKIFENKGTFNVIEVFSDYSTFHNQAATLNFDVLIINPKTITEKYKVNSKIATIALVYDLFSTSTLNLFDAVISINDTAAQAIKTAHEAISKKKSGAAKTNESGNELSEREREILISVASGLTNKEIAYKHNISIYTVISHRKNIARKTGIKTVSGLTVYAMLNGLIEMK